MQNKIDEVNNEPISEFDTGLRDDDGTPIHDGDTIVWVYNLLGTEIINTDGTCAFIGNENGKEKRLITKKQVVKYEVKEDKAGYFLDKPSGFGITELKCELLTE